MTLERHCGLAVDLQIGAQNHATLDRSISQLEASWMPQSGMLLRMPRQAAVGPSALQHRALLNVAREGKLSATSPERQERLYGDDQPSGVIHVTIHHGALLHEILLVKVAVTPAVIRSGIDDRFDPRHRNATLALRWVRDKPCRMFKNGDTLCQVVASTAWTSMSADRYLRPPYRPLYVVRVVDPKVCFMLGKGGGDHPKYLVGSNAMISVLSHRLLHLFMQTVVTSDNLHQIVQ